MYHKAKEIFQEEGLRRDLAITLANLGNIQIKLEKLGQAEKLHREALDIFRKIGYRTGEILPLIGLGNIKIAKGQKTNLSLIFQSRCLLAENQETGSLRPFH